jgi:CTP:molybdopterin cytidylyltransferase MocA
MMQRPVGMWIRPKTIKSWSTQNEMNRKHISALVLAAGMSTRMGRCKLDLPWNDSTILGSILTALDNECIERIVVVSGAYPAEVRLS